MQGNIVSHDNNQHVIVQNDVMVKLSIFAAAARSKKYPSIVLAKESSIQFCKNRFATRFPGTNDHIKANLNILAYFKEPFNVLELREISRSRKLRVPLSAILYSVSEIQLNAQK